MAVQMKKKSYLLFLFSGDIGGQMGLFIGASVLTILEILDYVYEVSLHCLGPLHIPQSFIFNQ